jgi:hypothetical protein
MKAPDDLFPLLLSRLGMKQNILPYEMRTQVSDLVAGLGDPQWAVRVACVQALGELQGKTSITSLVGALTDEHDAVRAAAARALGELGEYTPVEPLVKALSDPSWNVRTDAITTLGALGARTPIQSLVHAIRDEDATVRATAVQALSNMGERAPIDALISALDDNAWVVREATVLALGKMGTRVPVASLRKAIHDTDATVREAAMLTLQQIHPDGGSKIGVASSSPSTDGASEPMPHTQVLTNDIPVKDLAQPDAQGTSFQNYERFTAMFTTQPLEDFPGHASSEALRDRTEQSSERGRNDRLVQTSERSPRAPRSWRRARRLQRPVAIGFAALVVAGLMLISLAVFQKPFLSTTAGKGTSASCNGQVGCVFFLSSQDTSTENSATGLNDEVQIDLHNLRSPAAGKSYYAWLLNDVGNPEGSVFSLGAVPVEQGNVHLLYRGDAHHTNLLATTSRFLITAEDASIPPVNPSLDTSTWLYYSELSQMPDPTDTVNHYSLLDHLRHLLVTDPALEALGIHGGLNIWLKRNITHVSELAQHMQEASKRQDASAMRQQLISILDYLDGQEYIQGDVPPGTPWLSSQVSTRIALLQLNTQQQPPGYLYHIERHLTAIAGNPYATPNQKAGATHLLGILNRINATLEQVRGDAKHLMSMTDAQLLQSASLPIINDLVVQATRAYSGQTDTATQQVQQEGVVQVSLDIQRLATFAVGEYPQ